MEQEKYYQIDGTSFYNGTPEEVANILSRYLHTNKRIRIFYGDKETGRDWMEEYDTIGTVGRSCGDYKIPLIIHSTRSFGGPAILTDCIVKITVDKQTIYKHPKYYLPELTITPASEELRAKGYTHSVWANGDKNIMNAKSEQKATNYVAFLKGERNAA